MPSLFSEYLSPANPIALGIITFLIGFFSVWLFGLIKYWRWLRAERKHIENNQNIQPLVAAQQEQDRRREDNNRKADPENVFSQFCEESSLDRRSPMAKHLKVIFLAGWDETRLEVGELINHTTSDLFRWNNLFRSMLAVFIVIGLFGTLFGLSDSLTELSPALKANVANETSTGNNETLTQALRGLLDKMEGALDPSICGIFFTILGVILYGLYLQLACHPVKSVLERLTLTVWVPQLYPTTSQKLIQTLQESEAQMRSGYETAVRVDGLVENIQTNCDKFNKSLKQADAITEPLAESGTKINAAASAISTAAAELNQGFTESLNGFADVLNRGFLQSLSEFSEKFTSSVTQLTGFQGEIRKLHQEFQEAANQKLDQQTEKLNQQTQNLIQVSNALGQVLNVLKDYETAYINSRNQIDETLQAFISKATETNTSIYTENREWFEKMSADNLQQLSAMQNHLEGNLETLKQNLVNELENLSNGFARNFKDFQQVLDNRLEVLNERLENFDTPLKETVEEIKGVFDERLTTLNERLEKFPEPIQESADHMRGTFANLVVHMREIVGDLQKEIKEQNEKYEDQLTGVKNLNESVESLLTQLDESSKNQKEAVNTLSSNVGGLTADIKSLDASIKSFTSNSGDLNRSLGAIRGHVETLGTASQELVAKAEKADVTPLTANIGRLNTAINEISQNSRTLVNAVNTLAKQLNSSESERQPKRSFLEKIWNLFSRKKTSGQTSADSQSKNKQQ